MTNDNPCRRPSMISRQELMFRLCIPLVSWQHHVKKGGVVPQNLLHSTTSAEVVDGIRYSKGEYVEWLPVARLLMAAFRDDQLVHTHNRLKFLGFSEDLTVLDKGKGVLRVNSRESALWHAATKAEKTGKAGIPAFITEGRKFGIQSLSASGLIVTDPAMLTIAQTNINAGNNHEEWEPMEQELPVEKVFVNTELKESTKAKVLEANELTESVDHSSTIDIDSIDFNDAEEVGKAMRRAKLITEMGKAEKERVQLAKISNSVVDLDDIEKLLGGVTKALRTTMDQSVPKVTSNVKGLIITALVMDDPTLQKKLNTKVSDDVISEEIRSVFNKSLKELSDLLGSFAKSLEDE